MISPKLSAFAAFVIIESVIGWILSTSIVVVNFKHWKKGSRLQPSDQIHVAMGLVNILLQCAAIVYLTITLSPGLFASFTVNILFLFMNFLFLFCFWLNACLCTHYLTNIADLNHHFFSWLKTRFSVITPKLILVAAVGSFIMSLSGIGRVDIQIITYDNYTTNSGALGSLLHVEHHYLLVYEILGCFLPFTISSLCLGYALLYILRHVCRIKYNDTPVTRPNLQPHIRAARTMFLLFVLSLYLIVTQTYTVTFSIKTLDISSLNNGLTFSFPVAQSFIIIQASSKLRRLFWMKLCPNH